MGVSLPPEVLGLLPDSIVNPLLTMGSLRTAQRGEKVMPWWKCWVRRAVWARRCTCVCTGLCVHAYGRNETSHSFIRWPHPKARRFSNFHSLLLITDWRSHKLPVGFQWLLWPSIPNYTLWAQSSLYSSNPSVVLSIVELHELKGL